MAGSRSDRLDGPGMEDNKWNLIQSCWEHTPSKRTTIEQIVTTLTPPTEDLSILSMYVALLIYDGYSDISNLFASCQVAML
jgi:hypothetical protein